MKMKKVLYAFASVALAGLMALTSCKSEEPGLKLDKTNYDLTVGEEVVINASGVQSVEWSVDPADSKAVSIVADGLKVTVKGLEPGTVNVVAKAGDVSKSCEIVVSKEEAELEPVPAIAAPAAGKVILAVRIPAGSICQGLGAVGAGFEGGAWDPKNALDFKLVEGTQTWYSVELVTTAPSDMQVKVIAYPSKGKANADWPTQWGMNTKDQTSVSILNESDVELDNSEAGGEVKAVKFVDATVVYLDVAAWKSQPCVKRNEAGQATFTLIANNTPAELKFIKVVGNFASDSEQGSWDVAKGAMLDFVPATDKTPAVWAYPGDVAVPEAFEYKYIWAAADTVFSWDKVCDAKDNFQMALDLHALDTVDKWVGGAAEGPEAK